MVAAAVLGTAGIALLAAPHVADLSWPFADAHAGLLAGAATLFLLACCLKAYGWRQLFAANERPAPLALAAANGGASLLGVALPGRFDDVVRVAMLRRHPGCPPASAPSVSRS